MLERLIESSCDRSFITVLLSSINLIREWFAVLMTLSGRSDSLQPVCASLCRCRVVCCVAILLRVALINGITASIQIRGGQSRPSVRSLLHEQDAILSWMPPCKDSFVCRHVLVFKFSPHATLDSSSLTKGFYTSFKALPR